MPGSANAKSNVCAGAKEQIPRFFLTHRGMQIYPGHERLTAHPPPSLPRPTLEHGINAHGVWGQSLATKALRPAANRTLAQQKIFLFWRFLEKSGIDLRTTRASQALADSSSLSGWLTADHLSFHRRRDKSCFVSPRSVRVVDLSCEPKKKSLWLARLARSSHQATADRLASQKPVSGPRERSLDSRTTSAPDSRPRRSKLPSDSASVWSGRRLLICRS